MASANLSQVLGTTRQWPMTAMSGGRAILNTFTADDVLTARVWPGQAQAVTYEPEVAWVDPAAGTLKVTSRAAQLADAEVVAGMYRLQVDVTSAVDGETRPIYYGLVEFEATAGDEQPLLTWVTYQDLEVWAAGISTLQQKDDGLTGFARERNMAMKECVAFILRRYCPVLGQSRRYKNAAGTGAGPYLSFTDTGPAGEAPPSREQVETWLGSPARVVLSEDLIEANALLTAAKIYGGTPGSTNPFTQSSASYREAGIAALYRAFVELDTKTVADGVATIRIDRNVTWLT